MFLLGVLRKVGVRCGVFVVASWRKVWQSWLAVSTFLGDENHATVFRFIFGGCGNPGGTSLADKKGPGLKALVFREFSQG